MSSGVESEEALARRPLTAETPAPRRKSSIRSRQALVGYLFIAPDVLGLALFVGLPMVVALGASFFSINGFGTYHFIGFSNFENMARDGLFWHSLEVTALYTAISTPLLFIVSLALALLVRRPFPGAKWVRTALFVPYVMSLVVVAVMWNFLLVDKQGLVPVALRPFGQGNVSFLGNPNLVLGSYVVISIWFLMGYQMVLFMAGLSDIPTEYEDAASIDGANAWQRFVHIIWPLLRPTSFFVGVTSVIGAVTGAQAFDLVFVLTQGGPAHATTTIILYIYDQAFTFGQFGYAAAMTLVVVVLLGGVTAAWFGVTRGGMFDER